jgi:hypothetical protein
MYRSGVFERSEKSVTTGYVILIFVICHRAYALNSTN